MGHRAFLEETWAWRLDPACAETAPEPSAPDLRSGYILVDVAGRTMGAWDGYLLEARGGQEPCLSPTKPRASRFKRPTANLVVRCVDGVVLEVLPGKLLCVEEREASAEGQTVGASSAEVRACFEGTPLARAHAVSRLAPEAFKVLAGGSAGRHYKTFEAFRYVGARITDPSACARLANASLRALRSAAKKGRKGHRW